MTALAAMGKRESKTPGFVNIALAGLALAVLVPLALIASQQPPPAIAEFAPQDQQQIKKAPNSQTGDQGQGQSQADILGQSLPSPTPSAGILGVVLPSPSPVDTARVRRCVGDPPRQTEDPQSPPCVPYFSGPNGGSTYSHGVTGSTINILYDNIFDQAAQDFATYFSRRFEFYGRRMNMISARSTIISGDPSVQGQINQAKHDDQEAHGFASMTYNGGSFGADQTFLDSMARNGLLTSEGQANLNTASNMSAYRPYQWSTVATIDKEERYLADFVCTTMARRAPRLAPPQPSLNYPSGPPTRRWALLSQRPDDGQPAPDVSILRSAMSSCGAKPIVDVVMTDRTAPTGDNIMAQFATNDVTTALCICDPYYSANLMTEGDKQHRYPEWVMSTHFYLDDDSAVGFQWKPDQAAHAVGLSWFNKYNAADQTFWYPALREVDPNLQLSPGVSNGSDYLYLAAMYRDLLALASGIQMAGPNLTPQTFQQGLFKARFANPGGGGPPYYQATIGYGPGNHSAYQDVALVWWSNSDTGYTNPAKPGTYCYANRGQRYSPGNFPPDDSAFQQQPCR